MIEVCVPEGTDGAADTETEPDRDCWVVTKLPASFKTFRAFDSS
jgi:hypothetical protein